LVKGNKLGRVYCNFDINIDVNESSAASTSTDCWVTGGHEPENPSPEEGNENIKHGQIYAFQGFRDG